jgi:type I restriction-modification system DNA methylase subunit
VENLQMIKNFFREIGFDFEKDLKPRSAVSFPISDQNLYDNLALTEKLKNNLFVFDSQNQDLHTNFYLLTIHLEPNELTALRLFIWNENKYDLYFTCQEIDNKTENETDLSVLLYLSSINPKETDLDKKAQIASFKGRDSNLIEKISKTHFTTGALWLFYAEKLEKLKKDAKTIDKNLIETLRQLYVNLDKIYKPLFAKYEGEEKIKKEQIVPALIDRTLFIKFLEDKHIINSTFYKTCFGDGEINYKKLLYNKDREKINKLFKIINDVFNNTLFQTPNIEADELPDNALTKIYNAISQTKSKDNIWILSLFDFQFDVLPTEFIGHIYEMFFSEEEQAKGGVFYTPKNLAQLIVNETIKDVGTVLDPACGSGMFLVMAYRKLLASSNFKATKSIEKIIEQRNELIKNYIFGIEKASKARRIAVFSLYLEILDNIDNAEIEKYVNTKIIKHKESLFAEVTFPPVFPKKLSFADNVVEANSLVTKDKQPHKTLEFDFIVGNPPFQNKGYGEQEDTFLNKASIELLENKKIAIKDIVVGKQLSQAFMAKIKDWSKPTTRFGFVQNSTNFDNESKNFTNFFFTYYKLEKFYDLSNLKDILFENTKETVCVTIFDNTNGENADFQYFCPELNKFSKAFKLILQNESKMVTIQQADLLAFRVRMRDYAVGNENDKNLLLKIESNSDKLQNYLLVNESYDSISGFKLISNEKLFREFIQPNYHIKDYQDISKKDLDKYHRAYLQQFVHKVQQEQQEVKFVDTPDIIRAFLLDEAIEEDKNLVGYIAPDKLTAEFFQRPRNPFIYKGQKILLNRFGGKIQAAFVKEDLVFPVYVYGIKIKDEKLYYLFTAIFNSMLFNYYISYKFRKRITDNFPNLTIADLKKIPIPTYLDKNLVTQITALSQEFCNGNRNYQGKDFEKLNELVFDLYDLDILETNRVKDFFAEKRVVNDNDFKAYKTMLFYTIELDFEEPPIIKHFEGNNVPFGMSVIALYFNNAEKKQPNAKKMAQGLLNEMLSANIDEPLVSVRKIFYGLNCIYIFKENMLSNWTQSKAYEDGQEIIATLSANEQKY